MKRVILFIVMLIGAVPSMAQTPSVVQWGSCSNTRRGTGTTSFYTCPLPEPSRAGNALIMAARGGNQGTGMSFSDDKSNTWATANRTTDAGNARMGAVGVALNVAAGTRMLTATVTGAAGIDAFDGLVVEVTNIATSSALDGNSGNFGTSTSITAGSFTPGTSGDFLFQYATGSTATKNIHYSPGSQANITWTAGAEDQQDRQYFQYGVYTSTSAINPTLSQASSSSFMTVAIALKAASSGSGQPAGIRVHAIEHLSYSQGQGFTTTPTAYFATTGNLIVAAWSGGIGSGTTHDTITGITDNNSNTYTCRSAILGSGGGHGVNQGQVCYAANATPGALTLSITLSSNANDNTVLLYDISGAATSPFDVEGSGTAVQSTNAATIDGFTLTPSTANGLVIGLMAQKFNTVTAINVGLIDVGTFSDITLDGPENFDQNNGWAHYYNPSTSNVTFTWTYQSATDPQNLWVSVGEAFKAPAGGGGATPCNSISLLGVGCR